MKHDIKSLTKKLLKLPYLIMLLILSIFVFGIGISWFLQTVGLSVIVAGTLATQLSILLYGILLFNFNDIAIKDKLQDKFSFDVLWKGVKLTVIILFINVVLSQLGQLVGFDNTEIPSTTQDVISQQSFMMTFLLPVVIAPICEEFAFRASLKYFLVDQGGWKPITYILVSSLTFGLLHWTPGSSNTLMHILFTSMIGLVYSISYIKSDNIYIFIVSHMVYNFIVITLATIV